MSDVEQLVLMIWAEQYLTGVTSEAPSFDRVQEWIANRTYPYYVLYLASNGDVFALLQVRIEAGLDVF